MSTRIPQEEADRVADACRRYRVGLAACEAARAEWHEVLVATGIGPTQLAEIMGLTISGADKHIRTARKGRAL